MLGFSPVSYQALSAVPFLYAGSIALAPAISVFAFTGAEKFSGSIALAPAISVFAFTGAEVFSNALALTEASPSAAITGDAYIASGSLALAQPVSVFALTEAEEFIIASLALTQPGSTTIVFKGSHNSLTAWVPPVIDNTRQRQDVFNLQGLRQAEADLKQLRTSPPALKQLRQDQPVLGE